MSLADEIERLAPYLRRFAFASIGDSDKGDACVAAALRHCLLVGEKPKRYLNVTAWLFGTLATCIGDRICAGAALPDLSTLPRMVFLLIAMERLSELEVQTALDIDEDTLNSALEQAEKEYFESVSAST